MWIQYLSPHKLKELIRHYSEFVTHPVSLRQIKTIQVPKEVSASEDEEPKEDGDEDDIEISDEEEEAEPEMEEVTTYEYEQINTDPAIWAREKDSIADDEYQEFFSVISKGDGGDAEDWTHFNAEWVIIVAWILLFRYDMDSFLTTVWPLYDVISQG